VLPPNPQWIWIFEKHQRAEILFSGSLGFHPSCILSQSSPNSRRQDQASCLTKINASSALE
jgi:hypothetical protein